MSKDKTTEHKNAGMKFDSLLGLFEQTQNAMQMQAARSVDVALVVRNWLFGWYIVEFENGGVERAKLYGKKLLSNLAEELKNRGFKGMSATNLKLYRSFYNKYNEISRTVPDQSLTELQKIRQTLSDQSILPTPNSEMPPQKTDDKSRGACRDVCTAFFVTSPFQFGIRMMQPWIRSLR